MPEQTAHAHAQALDEHLDIFGQQPRINTIRTQICFCFSCENHDGVAELLRDGLERLAASFPWVAGLVIRDEADGTFKIRPSDKPPLLKIRDLRDGFPGMRECAESRFPSRILDEEVIAPCQTFGPDGPAPVLAVQANLIQGGVLAVFSALHSTMDMTGQAEVIRLFSKACRGEPFTDEEVSIGNLPRRHIIPLLGDEELKPEHRPAPHKEAIIEGTSKKETAAEAEWAYFIFADDALRALKSQAMASRGLLPSDVAFISTDDALSAFIWQSITRARMPRLFQPAETRSVFTRMVDARSHLSLPETYAGLVVFKTPSAVECSALVREPLGVTASRLRRSLRDVGYATKAVATLLSRGHAGNLPGTDVLEPSTGVNLSSWTKARCYELDFGGILGKPEAVRRPSFKAWEGLVYLMPTSPNGEMAVAVCLRGEDMMRLRNDEEFARFASYIG